MKLRILFFIASFLLLGASCDLGGFSLYQTKSPGGLFVSRDGGETWQILGSVTTQNGTQRVLANTDIRQVFFDPRNANHVYIVTKGNGVWESKDKGEHVTLFLRYDVRYIAYVDTKILFAIDKRILLYDPKDGSIRTLYIHGDPNAVITRIEFSPQGTLIALVSTGEILVSSTKGESWSVALKNNVQLEGLMVSKGTMFAYTSYGGVWSSSDGGSSWDQVSKVRVTAMGQGGAYVYMAQSGTLQKSGDNGASWIPMTLLTKDTLPLWSIVGAKDEKVLYYATESAFYSSRDGGVSWKSRPLPAGRKPIILQFAPDGALYLGFHSLE